ncbi:MAG: SAM-dependent chlorinase/fluorinase [Sedimentisphaerales bacterium]|nr:SAM-dependent chlorinase/fluorinase [Sedimentisphaerales bacterium]
MIVLLTDFGFGEYVGVVKGVILTIDPDARIVDLCHDIRPQSIVEASWVLRNNFGYFPTGSTFCCVVDPGVGTDRRAIAVQTESYHFIAPDNGLLWETVSAQRVLAIRQIPVPEEASSTFHGRDVFAKTAARVNLGRFDELGPRIENIERFELHRMDRKGTVVRIDRFGNIVTNLPPLSQNEYHVRFDAHEQTVPYFRTYEEAPENALILITGSHNTLELSVKNADANALLHLAPGQTIVIA